MTLRREVGLPGAILIGLGSILGTGVFVGLGLAAGVAGDGVLLAVVLAAAVAACNGVSSARLAARYPVSGGSYEYAHRTLSPVLGFAAGWTFLCAKSASAATAALGVAGHLLEALALPPAARRPLALAAVAGATLLAASGISRSNRANALIVGLTLASLAAFAAAALWRGQVLRFAPGTPDLTSPGLAQATALVFVAFTGYGRIATLGEEARDPARTIPRAVMASLAVATGVYLLVAVAALSRVGAEAYAEAARSGAPLEKIASGLGVPGLGPLLAVGALAALLGVLLNLLLGLSRVALAMGRRGDLPGGLAALSDATGQPRRAVFAAGAAVALLALPGNLAAAWSFSAFAVLLYYAVTNLAALRLPGARLSRLAAVLGLAACAGLAFQVPAASLRLGLAVLALGLAGRAAARALHRS